MPKSSGFTLIELLIIVTIIITTSVYLIPNIRSQRQRQALKNASDQLASDLKSIQNGALSGVKCGNNTDKTAASWNFSLVDNKSYKKSPNCLDGTSNPTVTYSLNSEIIIKQVDILPTCTAVSNFSGFVVKFDNITGATGFEAPVGCISPGLVMRITLQVVSDSSQTAIISVSKVDNTSGANIYVN